MSRFRSSLLALILLPLAPALGHAGSEARPDKARSAAEQLDIAQKTKRQAVKKSGEEKRAILESSAAAYRAVLTDWKDDAKACAEAAFRIGEIERTLGDEKEASAAFDLAVARGAEAPRLAARALNELGHLARRASDESTALAYYERVLGEYPGEEDEGVKALTWIGKVQASSGDPAKARATWLSLGDRFPTRPVAAVRAADLAAVSALRESDREGARKIVEETRARYSEANKQQAWWTPEVEEALGRMRSAAELEGKAAPPPDLGDSAGPSDDDA